MNGGRILTNAPVIPGPRKNVIGMARGVDGFGDSGPYRLSFCFPAACLSMTKFVFVTGGVVSSLGKGIAAASLGAILESRGIKVTHLKLDPYINVDLGTMSPF